MRPHARSGFAEALASSIVRRPWRVVCSILLVSAASLAAASTLRINSNQLDLISQDLREVKDVKRVIDMVGGSGFLMLGLRSHDEAKMKHTADALATMLREDTQYVRAVTYRVPVEFIQQNIGLFVKTDDLLTFQQRVRAYLKAQVRAANPFMVRLHDASVAPALDVQDLVDKYSHVGQKTLLDDYYISPDRKMVLLLIKPRWDHNELAKTHDYLEHLRGQLAHFHETNAGHAKLTENYEAIGDGDTIDFGFTGSYKTSLDDSYAIKESLEPVSVWAFCSIALITVLFFRRLVPALIVMSGMALGTIITMGFCRVSVGQLNMITSILGGILMGFGVDYGIHFIFRTRIELGQGKDYRQACRDALVQAGRPALVAAIVTGGSFLTLCASQFRGFSEFGFLAGIGTVIIGVTMFLWSAACIAALGDWRPHLVPRLIGTMPLPTDIAGPASRVPRPKLLLAACAVGVAAVCGLALPRAPDGPFSALGPGLRFNYNSRALMAEGQSSIKLQDEINRRFQISSDPVAVYSKDLEQTRALYDALEASKASRPSVSQVMSLYTFVPPQPQAGRNRDIMHAWHEELQSIDVASLPADMQPKFRLFLQALMAEPFDVEHVPEVYAAQFRHLTETRAENQGYLTYLYPGVDLWDGEQMLRFADQVDTITDAQGRQYHAAGAPMLFAQLARIVLFDGKLTLALAAGWILLMHFADFRSIGLALASVLPLGLGLGTMLGAMAITNHPLNFMNIIMLPILLGFGVSHGLYLLHRFLEGTPARVALRSVGAAVASSTATAIAGFASLFAASHQGLKSMGYVACIGLTTTLIISFTVLAAVLQLIDDRRAKRAP